MNQPAQSRTKPCRAWHNTQNDRKECGTPGRRFAYVCVRGTPGNLPLVRPRIPTETAERSINKYCYVTRILPPAGTPDRTAVKQFSNGTSNVPKFTITIRITHRQTCLIRLNGRMEWNRRKCIDVAARSALMDVG